jgi:hypothetical protein
LRRLADFCLFFTTEIAEYTENNFYYSMVTSAVLVISAVNLNFYEIVKDEPSALDLAPRNGRQTQTP